MFLVPHFNLADIRAIIFGTQEETKSEMTRLVRIKLWVIRLTDSVGY